MNSNSSNDGQKLGLEDVVEEKPEAKHGDDGQAANENRQAGPNSDRGGQPIAPQTGNPRADDRRPN